LGVAACESQQDAFTGPKFYQQLLKTPVEGISGHVSFDNVAAKDFSYGLSNIRILPSRLAKSTIFFDTVATAEVDLGTMSTDTIGSFVYADNTTIPPSPYAPLEEELNLIPPGLRVLGLCLGGTVMLLYRKSESVRAKQLVFLCVILFGTFVMMSAVIPLSLQESVSQHGLDIACA
jgi:hypothetical protein